MNEEICKLVDLPMLVWERLAAKVDGNYHARTLRSEVLQAAHVSAAFINFRVLRETRRFPWLLAVGDVVANLEYFRDHCECPTEVVACNIWELLQEGL